MFVGEQYRNHGIGSELLFAILEEMKFAGTQTAFCDFARNDIIHNFLFKNGFEHYCYSVYMTNETILSKEEFTGIRHYEDKDYIETFELVSRAFHNMRLSVGLNSKCDESTDKSRNQYADNSNDLFVLESDGKIVASLLLNKNCIENVAVKIDCQRHGYGRKMIKFALSELYRRGYSKCLLWCLVGNPAEYLYKTEGFVAEDCYEIMNMLLSNCNYI
jgi:GNAT superfamily N-acetyltransferase